LQINEFSKNKNFNITVYYTYSNYNGHNWEKIKDIDYKEVNLQGVKISKKYGHLNSGLINIVKNNDLILIGGYEQPTYILLSYICRLYNTPFAIIFDGINPNKIYEKESYLKWYIKSKVINRSTAIFANGVVSREYFTKKFKYPNDKIYNQFLTVDVERIFKLSINTQKYCNEVKAMYNISEDKHVIVYSGRLINLKKVDNIITAVSMLANKEECVILLIGDGEEENSLIKLAKKLEVNLKITGFINDQEELFKHYFAGDFMVFSSENDVWGLVINEAMAAGLPIIASGSCGAGQDLVRHNINGFIYNSDDIETLSKYISTLIKNKELMKNFGQKSHDIISQWTFKNSRESLEDMVRDILGI
jgi:L-malate glycosyltransferase